MSTPRIVITDCDHASIEIEQTLARERGVELVAAQARTEDEVIDAARGAAAIAVQYAPVTARVLDGLPGLRAVGRYGVGVDTVDVDAATARGVAVCNVPDYGTEDVSDHAIALALSLTRGILPLDRNLRRGDYGLAPAGRLHRNRDRVFGVVGLGLIGAATARKARGVGFTAIGTDPRFEPGTVTDEGVTVVARDELLARADVVSLHLPLTPATRHFVGAEVLGAMMSSAILINTCRGGVVDTDALVTALREGTIAGAGLDVFETEPLPADHPLTALDNVALTPHAGWYTEESYAELKRRTVENVVDVAQGIRPRDILNPQVLNVAAAQ